MGSQNAVTTFSRNSLIAGPLCLNIDNNHLTLNSTNIDLTPKAFIVLKYLMQNSGKIISREQLLKELWCWKPSEVASIRVVDLRINELRHKLGCDPRKPIFIETVYGQGYRFIVPAETN